MNRPTNRYKCGKIFENCAIWSISAIIDYSFLLITSTAYYKSLISSVSTAKSQVRSTLGSFRTLLEPSFSRWLSSSNQEKLIYLLKNRNMLRDLDLLHDFRVKITQPERHPMPRAWAKVKVLTKKCDSFAHLGVLIVHALSIMFIPISQQNLVSNN